MKGIKGLELSGIGGIETWKDAAEYLALGCRNVQATTAIMQYGYRIVEDLKSGMMHFMDERGYEKLDEFIGCALNNIIPAEELNRDYILQPKFNSEMCLGCGRCYISLLTSSSPINLTHNSRSSDIVSGCIFSTRARERTVGKTLDN